MSEPLVVAYGGGVNSTALLVGMKARGLRPDLILFADTGGEKPETYDYVVGLGSWLSSAGFPPVTMVANGGQYRTLEAECLARRTLPSLAFGWRSCSDKYKRRPQDNHLAAWPPARADWARGDRVVKVLGIDAGEAHRAANPLDDAKYRYAFPLIEWGWGGTSASPRSAPRACRCHRSRPASSARRAEVLALATEHPDLFARAVAMEDAAKVTLTAVKGLGRRYAWGELVVRGRIAVPTVGEEPSLPCQCFDVE